MILCCHRSLARASGSLCCRCATGHRIYFQVQFLEATGNIRVGYQPFSLSPAAMFDSLRAGVTAESPCASQMDIATSTFPDMPTVACGNASCFWELRSDPYVSACGARAHRFCL